jgi:hypothetical protein
LKTRFARRRHFYENLNRLDFRKIAAIAAAAPAAERVILRRKKSRRCMASTHRSPCNRSFTIQPAVHHAARMAATARAIGADRVGKIPHRRLP